VVDFFLLSNSGDDTKIETLVVASDLTRFIL
jgi:hypothetical protein